MCYSIESRDRIYEKTYGLLSFAKNMSKNIGKNVSGKYSQKLLDSAKKSSTDAMKTASKRAIRKAEEVTGDLIGNKVADKISVSKELHSKKSSQNTLKTDGNELETPKERYLFTEKRQQIVD